MEHLLQISQHPGQLEFSASARPTVSISPNDLDADLGLYQVHYHHLTAVIVQSELSSGATLHNGKRLLTVAEQKILRV